MKKNIAILSMSYIMFLILLFLSGALSGVLSDVAYYAAFILPIALALYATRGETAEGISPLSIDGDKVKRILPLIAPTVAIVVIISFVTSLLIFLISGRTNEVDLGDNFVSALFLHALLPAILEEVLFRYLPMRLLSHISRRVCVLASAIFFALVHHDVFSIPYAFAAGIIFMTVDLMTDSVIPSVLIHFINNALSVGVIVFSDNIAFAPTVYVILGILTLISLSFLYRRREEYLTEVSSVLKDNGRLPVSIEMIAFAVLTLGIAVLNLL